MPRTARALRRRVIAFVPAETISWQNCHPTIPSASAFLLRLQCLAALLRRSAPERIDDTTPFRFLLFVTFVGWRRTIARQWYASNRPNPPAPLRTFYVDAAIGSDLNPGTQALPFQTLVKIKQVMQPGDRFYLRGDFSELVDGNNFMAGVRAGTASAWIRLMNWPGATATLTGYGGYGPFVLNGRGPCYYWIEGLRLACGDPLRMCTYPAIFANNTSWIVVKGCAVSYKSAVGDAQFSFKGASDIWIEGCTFENAPTAYAAIVAGNWIPGDAAARVVVYDNTVGDGYHGGVEFGLLTPYVAGCRVAFNRVANRLSGGIGGACTDGIIVEGNDVSEAGTLDPHNLSSNNLFVIGRNGTYRYNRLWASRRQNILMQATASSSLPVDCRGNRVYHNVVWRAGDAALAFVINAGQSYNLDCGANRFENNLCWDNCAGLIDGLPGFNLDLYVSGGSPYTRAQWGAASGSTTTYSLASLPIRGNLIGHTWIHTPVTNVLRFVGDAGTVEYSEAQAIAHFGANFANNVCYEDPLFVSTNTGDLATTFLAIATSSPAVDAGLNVDDHYQGAAPDIGAYEA
jgi:hypothetical protein